MKKFRYYVPPFLCILLSIVYLICAFIPNTSDVKTMIALFGFGVLFLVGVGGIIFTVINND